jgi:hypothetical protein
MRTPGIADLALGALLVLPCGATDANGVSSPREAAQGRAQVAIVAHDCLGGYSAPIFDPLRGKLAPRAQDVSSAMLALKSGPSQEENAALVVWVQLVTTCRENVLAMAGQVDPPERVAILDAAWRREIAKLQALREGRISYGEYAAWLKQAGADTAAALGEPKSQP